MAFVADLKWRQHMLEEIKVLSTENDPTATVFWFKIKVFSVFFYFIYLDKKS